jgi:hypothetical protein
MNRQEEQDDKVTGVVLKKGKNFSCNNVGGKRKKSDFYQTPPILTKLLLDNVKLVGSILEPACGFGAITKVLSSYGYSFEAYDLNVDPKQDFLKEKRHFDTIITNPPFSIAYQFIQHAKKICDEFYFLLPLSYLHGKKRYDHIYTDKTFPLNKVWIFTRYPMLTDTLRSDGLVETGMIVYAWMQFTKGYQGKSTIEWLDVDPYIYRKNSEKKSLKQT